MRARMAKRCAGCGRRLRSGAKKYHSRNCRLTHYWRLVKADPFLHAAEKQRIRSLKRPETAELEAAMELERQNTRTRFTDRDQLIQAVYWHEVFHPTVPIRQYR